MTGSVQSLEVRGASLADQVDEMIGETILDGPLLQRTTSERYEVDE